MKFEIVDGKKLLRVTNPILWKAAGVGQYENEFDKTLSHLFKRLIKEMNHSFENNDTNELIYTFAYKRSPSLKWKGLEILKNEMETDIIFTPTEKSKKRMGTSF
jgi:hypothetical protein